MSNSTGTEPAPAHEDHLTNEPSEDQLRRSPTDSSKIDAEEASADFWKPSEDRPANSPFTAWTPDFWRIDTHSQYGQEIFREFVLPQPLYCNTSPLKQRGEAISWADEFVQNSYKVYRGFPKMRCHGSDRWHIIGVLADLVNAFVFHVYRASFRRKVVKGETQQIKDLREYLCETLKLDDHRDLLRSRWETYDELKLGGVHFETAVALWRSVMDDPGKRAANRIELLGKRIAIYGESTFGSPGIQALRHGPVRAVQVLRAHAQGINPASCTFLDALEKREQKIKDLELRLERYKCITADLYFCHILEQLPGPVPLDGDRRRTLSATRHWHDFLRAAVVGADDINHPLHPLLRLENDKQRIAKMVGENLYRSLSINIHHEFISLDIDTSADRHGQIIPDLRYSKLKRALFKAILPLTTQPGEQPDWDREKERYITAASAASRSSNWRN